MRDITAQLESYQEHLDELYSAVTIDEIQGLEFDVTAPVPVPGSVRRIRVLAFAAAFAVTLGLGAMLVFLQTASDQGPPAQTTPPVVSTTVQASTQSPTTTSGAVSTSGAPPDTTAVSEWNPVLATTHAGQSPAPAMCPPGSNPDALGPADQERPRGAAWSNQAAVFDTHTGRVIFVDGAGSTWTFDVCTNTWEEQGEYLGDAQLVYDVDSARTIAFRVATVKVYNAADDTWTVRPVPSHTDPVRLGAAYDPMSGLVVGLTESSELVAYDVDTDTWTTIGEIGENDYPPHLVGLADTSRIALLRPTTDHPRRSSGRLDDEGMVIDLRTGAWEALRAPPDGVFAGFGRLGYATGTSTAVVETDSNDICLLDTATLEWACWPLAEGPDSDGKGLLAAIVGDLINDRVVLIYGYGEGFNGARYYDVNDIWAIDFDTGEWTQLLEQTGDVTFDPAG